MVPTFIDLTEFLNNPIRTGIQRVVREILSNWPSNQELIAVDYTASDGLVGVDESYLKYARNYIDDPYLTQAEMMREMATRPRSSRPKMPHDATIIVPELFFDPNRALFYNELGRTGKSTAFIMYDFLPWQYPGLFNLEKAAPLNYYLLAATSAGRRCFISEAVRIEYFRLLANSPPCGDPSIPLGNDGLVKTRGAARMGPLSDYFLCFGAFDGRKKQHLVMEAFLNSKASESTKLIFAGRIPPVVPDIMVPVVFTRDPRVVVIDDPLDTELAELVLKARAVVFVSDKEGYGLPATEGLYAGVPVVINEALPAVANLPGDGQIRLLESNVANIKAAFDRLADDGEVASLRDDTARLDLPTWADYGRAIASWARG
jgi:glycosyltransferase involved in cell wall biosynthesis